MGEIVLVSLLSVTGVLDTLKFDRDELYRMVAESYTKEIMMC